MELIEKVRQQREYSRELYGELQDSPIDLDQIFNVMVQAIHHNYVGFEQKKQYYTPAEYHTYVFSHFRYHTLTVEMLARCMIQLAADMHDRNLRFECDDWIDYRNLTCLYEVRATKDSLWVTAADERLPIKAGEQILRVQRLPIEKVRDITRHNSFYSREPEREIWSTYLSMAQSLLVLREDGRKEGVKMPLFAAADEPEPAWENTCVVCGDGTVVLKLQRMDEESISHLIEENRNAIEGCRKLILDLRRCAEGGSAEAGLELLRYLTDRPRSLTELLGDEGSYVYCTKTNCQIRISQLEAAKENLTDPDEIGWIEEELEFYRAHAGEGMVYRPPMYGDALALAADPAMAADDTAAPAADAEAVPASEVTAKDPEVIEPAEAGPEQVVLITDTFCEMEGEAFAAMCQRCGSRVKTVGRPTMGTLDYDDCITISLNDHMRLSYPIRMSKAAYEGRGISEKGLPVDEYIAWTPEEITEDLLMKKALEM